MLAVIAASCRVSKSVLRSGRTSPMSVDSGFESSSFPSSPDSSNDTSILATTHHPQLPSSAKCISLDVKHSSLSSTRTDIITDEDSCLSSSLPSESQLSLPSDTLTLPLESPISLPSKSPSSESSLLSSELPQPSYLTANTSSPSKSQDYPQHQVPSSSSVDNHDDNSLITVDFKCDNDIISTKSDDKPDNNNDDKLINNEMDDIKVSNEIKESGLKLSEEPNGCVLKCASIASSSSSLISLNTNNVSDNSSSELLSLCHWDRCMERFKCDNDLYDHVIKNHLEILRPRDCLSPNSRGKCSQRIRMKTLPCKWEKRSNSEENDTSKLKSCYQWTPVPYYPPCEDRDFLDSATDEWLVMRLREYERVTNGCLVVRDQEKRGGAQYRKRRRVLHFEIATFKQKPPTKVMCMSEKKRLLNDAFFSQQQQHTNVHLTTANCSASSLSKKASNLRNAIK
ncbi:unnamed protein product [Anisakis simplex]|uniref:C2H2-type domain-containing protein n=1 Tax=Anisakis simplex TaxID=6269 RepID=A0A0M3JT46_ANISI|nr:unnamed protein product [Anisakis simplex]